jgi:hypothetical protein
MLSLPALRLTLALTLLAWIAIVVMIGFAGMVGQTAITQAAALLQPPDDCPPPCWQGIRPGSTSSGDGIERLKHLPWVTNLSVIQGIVSYDSIVRWSWNQPPNGLDSNRDGRMWTHQGQVYLIELPLTLRLATVWNALGPPDWIELTRSPQQPPAVFLHAWYHGGRLTLEATVPCPVSPWRIWSVVIDATFKEADVQAPADRNPPLFAGCG